MSGKSSAPRSDARLVRREENAPRSSVTVRDAVIGLDRVAVIAGPCAVENPAQIMASAREARRGGACMLRAGAFKPRTSPYSFQGMGLPGLELLAEASRGTGLPVVTEVLDPADVPMVAPYADMLQVGARNMHNAPLLRAMGAAGRPVLLKRAMSATIEEWLLAAEYIADAGNPHIVLCERGIRTFETSTRFTTDLSAVPVVQQVSRLPVVVDPSHAAGREDLVLPLALAAVAAGADGIMVDLHPERERAMVDGAQALIPEQFHDLMARVRELVRGSGRQLVTPPDQTWVDRAAQELELADLRKDLDGIDERLIALAAERVAVAHRIGGIKNRAGLDLYDPVREEQVLTRARTASERHGLPPSVGTTFMELLITGGRQARDGSRVEGERLPSAG